MTESSGENPKPRTIVNLSPEEVDIIESFRRDHNLKNPTEALNAMIRIFTNDLEENPRLVQDDEDDLGTPKDISNN